MLGLFRLIFVIVSTAVIIILPAAKDTLKPRAEVLKNLDKKKLIEWGWDHPTTAFMRQNMVRMEQMPFDGIVFDLTDNNGKNQTWTLWGGDKLDYAGFSNMVDDLTHTHFVVIKERFVRVNVTPGTVDWIDDEGWRVISENFAVASKVAKTSGCKGLLFDVEQYQNKLFDFSSAPHKVSRETYRKRVRQRGREWIAAVSSAFPDIIILFPWAYHEYEVNKETYELLKDFLDGIFEAAPASVRLVDAGEAAYARPRDVSHGYTGNSSRTWAASPLCRRRIEGRLR